MSMLLLFLVVCFFFVVVVVGFLGFFVGFLNNYNVQK